MSEMADTDTVRAEIITAVDHRDEIEKRFKQDMAVAKERVQRAAMAVVDIEDAAARLGVVLVVYDRVPMKATFAKILGLSQRRIRFMLHGAGKQQPCRDCSAEVSVTWENFEHRP